MFPCAFNIGMFGKPLPYLRRVAYLESHGTEWIGLPFGFNRTDVVESEFSLQDGLRDKYIVAPSEWNTDHNRFGLGVHTSDYTYITGFTFAFGDKTTGYTALLPENYDENFHKWDFLDNVCRVETGTGFSSVDVSEIEFGSTTSNLKLFYGYNSSTKGKVKSYRHYKNAVVVIDLIPVLDLSGRPAMYDKVSGNLFYNQGTGEFTWGELGE